MSVPDFQSFFRPMLEFLADDTGSTSFHKSWKRASYSFSEYFEEL